MPAFKFLLLTLLLFLFSACSGGSSGRDTGLGGSGGGTTNPGRVVGTFQGAGSIIINDRILTTADAEFEVEGGSGESDLEEGQRLIVFADLSSNEADRVIYRSDIRGPVTSTTIIDPLSAEAEITVLGQTVLTNAATRLDGISLDLLTAGELIEVSGSQRADGAFVATFLELKSSLPEYKVVGIVDELDVSNRTLELGGLLVDYSAATLAEFQGADLAEEQRVEVTIAVSDFTAPANALASEVELLVGVDFEDGEEVEYEGLINRFASAADFDVDGLSVTTASDTEFENGSAANLALNVKVEVEGVINGAGTLVADKVIFKSSEAVRVEGTVSFIDETAGTVATDVGLTFEIRTLTELEDDRDGVAPFGLSDLQVDDYVELRGFLDGPILVAAELEREEFDTRTRLRGPVTAEDEAAGTVDILGITVSGVVGLTDYDSTQAEFHAEVEIGTFVEAEWDPFVSTDEPADSLSIED